MSPKMNIAVFCSGNGSNFQAIINAARTGFIRARIGLMVCDNPAAYAIKRAKAAGIKTLVLDPQQFSSKKEFEARIIKELTKEGIALICLAGYMRILSNDFVKRYKNRIINVHPALLPSFKGAHGIKDALDYGVSVTGVTVHFVSEDIDSGPIILQEPLKIKPKDTASKITKNIHNIEHKIYPQAIRLFIEKRLKVSGRRVKIISAATAFILTFGFNSEAIIDKQPIIIPVKEIIPLRQASININSLAEEAVTTREKPKGLPGYNANLSLTDGQLYDKPAVYYTADERALLNPADGLEKKLTKDDIEKMRLDGSVKIANDISAYAQQSDLEFIRSGADFLADTAKNVVKLRNHIVEKYNLHFKADSDEVVVRYKKRF